MCSFHHQMDVHLTENGRKAIGVVLVPLPFTAPEAELVRGYFTRPFYQSGKEPCIVQLLQRREHDTVACIDHVDRLGGRGKNPN